MSRSTKASLIACLVLLTAACSGVKRRGGDPIRKERSKLDVQQVSHTKKCEAWSKGYRDFADRALFTEATNGAEVDEAYDEWKLKWSDWWGESPCMRRVILLPEASAKERAAVDDLRQPHVARREQIRKDAADAVSLADAEIRLHLIGQALAIDELAKARGLLSAIYNTDAEVENEKLREQTARIGESLDKALYREYRQNRGYGRSSLDDSACVFSRREFPRNPKKVRAGLDTHFEGSGPVYVICRLPAAARSYADDDSTRLRVRLVGAESDGGDALAIGADEMPSRLGRRRWIRATFDLPPASVAGKTRWMFRAEVLKLRTASVGGIEGGLSLVGAPVFDHEVLARGLFTWHQ